MSTIHIELYNRLDVSLRHGDLDTALPTAREFHDRLKDAMAIYGWHKFPLTGNSELDAEIQKLDRYLTGPRE